MIIYTLYKHYYCIVFLFVINYNICRHIYSYLCHACLRVSVCVFYGKVCWNLPFGEIILVIRFCFIFVNIPEKYPFVLLMTKTYKLIAFTSKKINYFSLLTKFEYIMNVEYEFRFQSYIIFCLIILFT